MLCLPIAMIAAEAAVWRGHGDVLWGGRQACLGVRWFIGSIDSGTSRPTSRSCISSFQQTAPSRNGPQIVLSGEVTSCNRLVVEGTIKANIKECRDIAIAQGGLFSGSAAVQSAEISGRFEGELKVSGRLLIRAPGLVSGTVQYRELEIERGGRIAGNVSAASGSGNGGTT